MTTYLTSSPSTFFSPTGVTSNPQIQSLLIGTKWDGPVGTGTVVSYSFPDAGSLWSPDNATGYGAGGYPPPLVPEPSSHYSGLGAAAQSAVTTSLEMWSHVANISFALVPDNATEVGDIRVAVTGGGFMDAGTYAYTYSSNNAAYGGDVWLNWQQPVESGNDFAVGANGWETMLHELGHALGLAHPFDQSGNPSAGYAALDSLQYTVMSYSDAVGHLDLGDSSFYPTTPMLMDIQALQFLYGANTSWASGNDLYAFNEGSNYYQTIVDTGGNDTIQYNSAIDGALIDLRGGFNFSQLGNQLTLSGGAHQDDNVTLYFTTVIENAIGGGGADTLVGNDAANALVGNDGSDSMDGGNGNDQLTGGNGFDTLLGGDGNDFLGGGLNADWLFGGQGDDTISGGNGPDTLVGNEGNDTLIGGVGADSLQGVDGNDLLQGGDGNDILWGGDGNDTLDGGLGVNTLNGGDGDDFFTLSDPASFANISGGAGFDELRVTATSAGDWRPPLGSVEGIDLVVIAPGTAAINVDLSNMLGTGVVMLGNDGANQLVGTMSSDTLDGAGGNDLLAGAGGADLMTGGAGNDQYDINDAGDVVVELPDAGHDWIWIINLASYTLPDNVEDLRASIISGAFTGTGNDESNNFTVVGTPPASVALYGMGGDDTLFTGFFADTLDGGSGVDLASYQNAAAGLAASLASPGGNTGAAAGDLYISVEGIIGSNFGDTLTGGAGGDYLDGAGGNDVVDGGEGNDTLGASSGDTVQGGNGDDVIVMMDNGGAATIDGGDGNDELRLNPPLVGHVYVLTAATLQNVETITTGTGTGPAADVSGTMRVDVDASGLAAAVHIVGNDGQNVFTGTAFGDTLDGGGGNDFLTGGGNDLLRGGAGDDIYILNGGADTIVELADGGYDILDAGADATLGDFVEAVVAHGGSGLVTIIGNGQANSFAIGFVNGAAMVFHGEGGDDSLWGGEFNDLLDGGDGNDLLTAGNGDDTLQGGNGDDVFIVDNTGDFADIDGGAGADEVRITGAFGTYGAPASIQSIESIVLLPGFGNVGVDASSVANALHLAGNDGNNILTGTAFGDTVEGAAGNDYLFGGDGNDNLTGANGFDNLFGGNGNDFLGGGLNADFLDGGNGNDLLSGGNGPDTLMGGGGNDSLIGGVGQDSLSGGEGDDTLNGGSLNDVLDGGNGMDFVDYSAATGAVTANLQSGDGTSAEFGVDQLISIDGVIGGAGNDVLSGGVGNDTLLGGAGNDSLTGSNGENLLVGGSGDDYFRGMPDGSCTMFGEDGNDFFLGSFAGDYMDGGNGDDTMAGASGADTVLGGAGNDSLICGVDGDNLDGGEGNDIVYAAFFDNDTLAGGNGVDTVVYSDANGNIVVDLSIGSATGAGVGNDQLSGFEVVLAGSGNDSLVGSAANETFSGGAGFDTLLGGDGNDFLGGGLNADWLEGGNGEDTLSGGNGPDSLTGGAGNDQLTGGVGADRFLYTATALGSDDVAAGGADQVIGAVAGDLIDITDVLGAALTSGGAPLASGVLLGAFQAGSTNIAFDTGTHTLRIDLDGDGLFDAANDFSISLAGVSAVTYDSATSSFGFS